MDPSFAMLVGLCLVPGIGAVTLRSLLERFGTIEAIRQATPAALQSVTGVGPRISAAIQAIDTDAIAVRIDRWRASGITLLTWSDLRYPALLHSLHDAPPLLFCRGGLPLPHANTVAIVGSRQPAPGARRLAEQLGGELAARGWIVVSGLAWGIDIAAHTGALHHADTVAVLGGGLDQIQPKKHALADRIQAQGLLLSELPPEATPTPAGLVARNRLISGISRAVIVVEAGEKSGSLYTARFAYRQKRPIFAVANGSAGNALLLQNGATPIPPDLSDWDALDAQLHSAKTGDR